jgi:hypothetical protein
MARQAVGASASNHAPRPTGSNPMQPQNAAADIQGELVSTDIVQSLSVYVSVAS